MNAYEPSPHLPLQFLKLGGSLITDKMRVGTPRQEALARLAGEIAAVYPEEPQLRLLLGHGAGSFAHVPAKKYATRHGVHTREDWRGFVEVWQAAVTLNRMVMDALLAAGLPAISMPPSASVLAAEGQVASWDLAPLRAALNAGLLPVVYGDVVFDARRGGTILSTEDLFAYLARRLQPRRLLLAGLEAGVWADYPGCTNLIAEITPQNLEELRASLGSSAGTDVTGGMESKVQEMATLAGEIAGLEILIFSGEVPGNVQMALQGAKLGTLVRARAD